MAESENSGGKQTTRFQKGTSGNPSGKPRGARNKTTLLAEKMMESDAADIVRVTIAAALRGDLLASKMILDRVVPVRKGRAIVIDLPSPIAGAEDLAVAAGVITAAVATGELTPDEGILIGGVLEHQRRAIETSDLARRLEALEQRGESNAA